MQSSSKSASAALGSIVARLHEIYRECLEHSSWATIVLETSTERISFSCREPPAAAPSSRQGKKRPANAKRMERNRKRREEWLERRNSRSLTSSASAVPPAAGAAPPAAVPHAAADTTATPSSYAKAAAAKPASSKHHSTSDKAVLSISAATAQTLQPKEAEEMALAVRASENPSDVTKRRNIPQLDGGDYSDYSLYEVLSPAAAPPPGYILCNICQVRYHDWVYSRCKHCKS
jgi:hypothetical protein